MKLRYLIMTLWGGLVIALFLSCILAVLFGPTGFFGYCVVGLLVFILVIGVTMQLFF